MNRYSVAHVDEIDELSDGRAPWHPVRHHFGITSFGVNAFTARDAGDRLINEHDESEPDSDEELYLVLSGKASFELEGERVEAPTGTFVFVPPGINRTAFADEAGTTVIVIGGVPGKPYQPTGWEIWAPLSPLYEAGNYAEAAERGRELTDRHPPYLFVLYNLACCESLAGEKEAALEHLRQAIELSDRARAFAEGDSDFDPIRDEPEFQQLTGR
jgi:tetratricopeptide (TPR) repeat protein